MRLKHKTYFWEQRKLGEVGYCQSGIGFPEREQGRKKGIPFYKVSDMTLIGNELIMVTSNNYVSEEQILKNRWKVINSIPAIIFAKVGAALLLDRKRLVLNSFLIDNNTMAYILNEKWDYYFCKTLFDTIYLPQLSQVGALPSFNGKDVENLNVIIPKSKEEQTAIGNFFKQLDETIALHRRNCIKFQNLKTAYLENIFSAKYIQNKDKNKNAWEQRKLGDIAEIVMGQSPNSGNYTNNPKDHILVQGNADIKNGKVFPRIWTTQITKIGKKNDLIMSVRAPVGDMAKTDYDVVLGRGVCAIKGNEFIYQILSKMKIDGYWNALSTGSTFDAINSNDIKKTLISIPKEQEEQTTIGNFFKQLDDTIALHQRFWMNNNQLGREYAELF
ncbi:MAG: restriction endonuclease subunit S [[Actinobacillus] rossii]|nr:restriction endonuclease subunit S [[Actinobacillus] rossii]MDY4505388.1 restriction endonuclease subunit S [[Actinobacillus] rossii]